MKFCDKTRNNWGYFDGLSAKERNRFPQWANTQGDPHPWDKEYGKGFWRGWEKGEVCQVPEPTYDPNSSIVYNSKAES